MTLDAAGTGRPRGFVAEPCVDLDRGGWARFVADRPEARHEEVARIVVRDSGGAIRGVAQAFVRATIIGKTIVYVPHGPVWDHEAPDGPEILEALVTGLRRLARAFSAIGVKMDPRALPGLGRESDSVAGLVDRGLRQSPFDLQARTTRIIDLGADEATRIASWSGDARNRWRRAEREGSTTEIFRRPEPGAMTAFDAVLRATAEHGRFRTRPSEFYAGLARELAEEGRFYLAVTSWEARPIAVMYVVVVGDRAFYLYGGAVRDVPRNTYGPYAAMAAMQAALARDHIHSLDVWGVAEPDDPEADPRWAGFSEFKIRFGGQKLRHPGTFDLPVEPAWWWLRGLLERLRSPR